jgi:hypothetical protein
MLQNRIQKSLFNEHIKSIGYNQSNILQDIMTLYCHDGFECDLTYSTGCFYKSLPKPSFKFDINPQALDVVKATSCNIPVVNEAFKSVVFDPPFEICTTGNGVQQRRFGYYKSLDALLNFYDESIKEIYRVLRKKGILVFKCQDLTKSSKNDFVHIAVHQKAAKHGFFALDLFILLAKQRIISPKHKNQKHARKYHSYLWVFVKR